jgi:cell division protein FtsB
VRAVVLVVVLACLLLAVAVPVRAWFSQRAQIAGLRADVEAAQARVTELEVTKERWQDPAFVAAQARARLHFVLPGEVGFVTLGVESAADQAAQTAADRGPWYQQLWGALAVADAPADDGDE